MEKRQFRARYYQNSYLYPKFSKMRDKNDKKLFDGDVIQNERGEVKPLRVKDGKWSISERELKKSEVIGDIWELEFKEFYDETAGK